MRAVGIFGLDEYDARHGVVRLPFFLELSISTEAAAPRAERAQGERRDNLGQPFCHQTEEGQEITRLVSAPGHAVVR